MKNFTFYTCSSFLIIWMFKSENVIIIEIKIRKLMNQEKLERYIDKTRRRTGPCMLMAPG